MHRVLKFTKTSKLLLQRNLTFTILNCKCHVHQLCIIGSGPAGFYAAQHLLKVLPNSNIDIYEKLPVPFGLVRYGVAPDHPEVKNVTHTFTTVLKNPRVKFIGNVEAANDISFEKFQESYDAILLSYGASEDRKLEIPGENGVVIPGREFVGWYNGLPENRNLVINLENSQKAIIIGHGNVALDIARILLSPVELLKKTDISTYALESLSKSNVKEVVIYGRRGPLQVSFTIKELRELIKLQGVHAHFDPRNFKDINEEVIAALPRPKKRLTELMVKTSQNPPPNDLISRHWSLQFLHSPLRIDRKDARINVTFELNDLDNKTEKVKSSGKTEVVTCDLIFRSVGYKGRRLFKELPFDETKGIIPNVRGRVQPGVYCCGWVGSGPRGVILSTMQNSFDVANMVGEDFGTNAPSQKSGFDNIQPLLKHKRFTSFEDYQKIEEYEFKSGTKVTTVEEMLRICGS